NSALLVKSGEESLSTIDITAIDLYTGQAHFYKAGAAPTFVRRGNRAGMVESTSLPVGILTAVEFEKSSIKLSDGDLVVMV
ncbi:SpoIIE family protein phosphatase, partial [Acinetobacter sp. 163]|nr:SpoIIE family protein phosphatase [Acinetobacter sp. 163]